MARREDLVPEECGRERPRALLGEEVFHHFPVDVGEAVVAALEAVGELFVVEPNEVHPGGLEVVNVDFVTGD